MQIDWKLLQKQKMVLLDVIDKNVDLETIQALNGILSLLDAIQDDAVESGSATEQQVFD